MSPQAATATKRPLGYISAVGPRSPPLFSFRYRVLDSLFVVFLPHSSIFYVRIYSAGYSDTFVRLFAAAACNRLGFKVGNENDLDKAAGFFSALGLRDAFSPESRTR